MWRSPIKWVIWDIPNEVFACMTCHTLCVSLCKEAEKNYSIQCVAQFSSTFCWLLCIVAISRKFSSPPEKREYKRHGLSDNYSGAAASVTTGWLWPIMKKVLGRAENSWTSGSILFSAVYVFSISKSRSLKKHGCNQGLDTSKTLCQIDLFHFSQKKEFKKAINIIHNS